MTSLTAVDELQELTDQLLTCLTTLGGTLGDTAALRRVVNDAQRIRNGIERLGIDLAELAAAAAPPRSARRIQIPDVDYDLAFWRDVDHEGVGAQSLAR